MIYLHIGRGKTGSGTIQHFLASVEPKLDPGRYQIIPRRRLGVALGVAEKKTVSSHAPDELRALLAASPNTTFFLSHEFLYDVQDPARIELIRGIMGPHDVTVIAYVRDYASLIVSKYNQSTKKGKNVEDFDAFAARRAELLSAVPSLTAWAGVFGWSNMRIRTLDPASLEGGNLVHDYASAVGLVDRLGDVKQETRKNISPPWEWLELRRAVIEGTRGRGGRGQRPSLRAAHAVLKNLQEEAQRQRLALLHDKVQYVTPDQWRQLRDSYNEELATLNSHIKDTQLPLFVGKEPPPRPYLPAVESYPPTFAGGLAKIIKTSAPRDDHERRVLADIYQRLTGVPGQRSATQQQAVSSSRRTKSRPNMLVEI
jgi:hypothetical protein